MNITKKELDKQLATFEAGIDKAEEHIKLIHMSTLLAVPDDLRERLYNATDAGTLIISDDGDVEFAKG